MSSLRSLVSSVRSGRSFAPWAAAIVALVPFGSAPAADFVGFVGEGVTVSTAGGDRYVIDVYAEFAQSSVSVVNLYDAVISNTKGTAFFHSDLNTIQSLPGTWSPGASISVGGADPTVDSFVAVGGDPGSSNTTTLDPNFTPATASVPPAEGGWYNSNPANEQGVVDPSTRRVLVGRFVTATPGDTLDFSAWITFSDYVGGVTGPAQQVQGSISIPYSVVACDTLAATAASTAIDAAGTSSAIAVSVEVADASCDWSASSNAAWLTLSAGSGTGNGSFTFTVAENTGAGSRAATITVESGTASDVAIVVTQAGLECSFAASPLQREISFIGSLYGSSWSFDVAAGASCAWTATPASGSSWLAVTSGGSGTGTGRVTYTVEANFFLPTRTGTIEIRSGGELVATHTVVQAQPAAECSGAVDFDSSSVSIAADAGTHSVDVTTNGVTCAWYASSADSWITVDNGGSFTGDGSVTFTVVANSSVSARTGTISIGSGDSLRTLSVEQSGICDGLAVSPTQRSIAFLGSIYGESYGFDLLDAGGTGCSWTLEVDAGSPAWLTVTSAASGSGAASVAYTADINLYAAQRTGTISVVVSGTIIATHTVVQAGPAVECTDPVLFEPSSKVVVAAGESFEVAVSTSGATCAWYAESSDAWITITNGEAFTGDGTMSVMVAENTDLGSRSGSITVGSGGSLATFTISQAGTGAETCDVLAASAASTSVPASGTSAPVAVTVTTGGGSCGWSASSNQSWLTLSGASGTGASGSFSYSASENSSTSSRSATITVISGSVSPVQIEITQEAASISCASVFAQAAVPGSTTVDASGTSGPVQIDVTTGGATCTWSASSDSSWLALASASGTGASGSFTFVASENLSASSRVGTITVSSGTATPIEVVVTQQGYSNCASAETVDPATASVTSVAGSGSVAITTPSGTCAWTATVTSGGGVSTPAPAFKTR